MSYIEKNQEELYLGQDVGGTKFSIMLGDSSFSIKKKVSFETRTERGYRSILDEFKEHIRSVLNEFPGIKIKRISRRTFINSTAAGSLFMATGPLNKLFPDLFLPR